MMTSGRVRRGPRYRVLAWMIATVVGISLFQILWAPQKAKLFRVDIGQIRQWSVTYIDTENHRVTGVFAAPVANSFVEAVTGGGPVRIEMSLPNCRPYSRYRFWVGPYGSDATDRQPGEWAVFVRGDSGDWLQADMERVSKPYVNNTWYNFPLRSGPACVRHIRVDVAKLSGGPIFRLFEFQLYNPSRFARLLQRLHW